MGLRQDRPLALAGYRFRRRVDRPHLVVLEIATRDGDVRISMSRLMLEALVVDATKMVAKFGDRQEVGSMTE